MKIILVHLSDSHFKKSDCEVAARYTQIAAALRPVVSQAQAVFIVYTGDVVYSGLAEEFEIAKKFIDGLKCSIETDSEKPVSVVITPGNHDGDFKNARTTRSSLISVIRANESKANDDDYISDCTEPLSAYYDFVKSYSTGSVVYSDKLWCEYVFDVEDVKVRFSSLNASWISTVPEVQGDLVFPIDKYASYQETASDLNILLLHHPLNWYAQSTYHPLRQMVKSHYQIVMSGHEHSNSSTVVSDFNNNSIVMLEAPALQSVEGSEFVVDLVDVTGKKIAQEKFRWDGQIYSPSENYSHWGLFINLPECRPKNGFHLSVDAKSWLGSLDASFSHPRKQHVYLPDVFVYPDLSDCDSGNENGKNVCSELLSKIDCEHSKVIIYGDEQFGKTSLVKHLFAEFHRQGLSPVVLDGKKIPDSADQFLKYLDKCVEGFYGVDSVVKYSQLPFSNKIVLVDNIDDVSTRGDVISRALQNIEGQFKRVILTAGERFEVTTVASSDAADALKKYRNFRMLGFGFKLRHDLIRRWYEIGSVLSQEEIQESVYSAEQTINAVLGKGLVPMTAFNTLVLLQTIEVNEKGSLVNAGMAQYYEYMYRHSLLNAKVKSDELDEVQSYLVYLAWRMFEGKVSSIGLNDLFEFNRWFSNNVHETDLVKKLELLLKAKILINNNDQYSFAYSYLEYFFVAKYLSIHCEDNPDLRSTIKHLCKHLYLKDNANIVLFLTYHFHGNWVIQEISTLLSEILKEVPVLQLEKDAGILNSWVNERAKLIVDTSNVIENNRKVRDSEDAASKIPERLPEREVTSIRDLDQISQLNLLFKTSEILGQVLKGRYGSIVKDVKHDLMKRLFDAPLRGVNFFNNLLNADSEGLLIEISNHLQKNFPRATKERIDKIAKRFIFQLVGGVADSFISRQGEIIGSPKLVDTLDYVVKESGTLSYEMVSIAAKLSYPNNPPVEQIRLLAEGLSGNYFGYKVLQGLVARHLYMFSLDPAERNKLAAAVGINVQTQRDIELKSQTRKKLPGVNKPGKNVKSLLSKLQDSFMQRNQKTIDAVLDKYKKPDKEEVL